MASNIKWVQAVDGSYTGAYIDGEFRPLSAIPAGWEPGTSAPPEWYQALTGQKPGGRWTMPLIIGSLAVAAGALYYYYGPDNG